MRFTLITLILLSGFHYSSANAAGIQVGRTRIIYDANKKEVALPLTNNDSELPWLIQAWADNGDGKTRAPFIVTPPLFRLDPQKEQSLRITWTGVPLPEDRESLFYLNVRTIPAVAKEDTNKNVLRLIYKTRLKLFWRPKGITGTSKASCETLAFRRLGNRLHIESKGAFYSVFDSLSVGGIRIKNADTIAPFSSVTLPLPAAATGKTVTWHCITDYGNPSEKYTTVLNQG